MTNSQNTNQAPHPLPPSTRLYIILETAGSAIALLLTVGSLVLFVIDHGWGTRIFGWFFYPAVLCIALTLFLSVTQLLRGFEITVFLPVIPAVAAIVCIILMLSYQLNIYGTVFIPPFNIFNM